jgi:hypothetical protein
VAPRLAAVVRDRMRRGALAAADRLAAEVSLLPGGAADLPPVAPPTSSLRMVDVVEELRAIAALPAMAEGSQESDTRRRGRRSASRTAP